MSLEEIRALTENLVERAEEIGVLLSVDLVWKETMAHPEFFAIREYLQRRFPSEDPLASMLQKSIATNGWSIARDPGFLDALIRAGLLDRDGCAQLTLLGLGQLHDKCAGRRGAFEDIETAADRLIAAGLGIQWTYILHGDNVDEIAEMSSWAHEKGCGSHKPNVPPPAEMTDAELDAMTKATGIDMRKKAKEEHADKAPGSEPCFPEATFLVKPQGGGRHLRRPKASDLERIPTALHPKVQWCGAACETESDLVIAMAGGKREIGCFEAMRNLPEQTVSLVIRRGGDVYSGCHEIHEVFRLGNIHADSLAGIMDRYRNNRTPALHARRSIGLKELAARYGRPDCDELHTGCSLCRTLVNRYLEDKTDFC
jgi:MoaA/NifB/PqqE/SkfB family radical SAM enzyme